MEKKGIILVIIILFGLSIGPVTQFLGGEEELEEPEEFEDPGMDQELRSVYADFLGSVEEVDPYLYVEVVDYEGDRSFLDQLIESEAGEDSNYSISSPVVSDGYNEHEAEIYVDNYSEARRIGFRLQFNLEDHYDEILIYRDSVVSLPSNITGRDQNEEPVDIYADNESVSSKILYSGSEGEERVVCPQMVVDRDGSFVRSETECIQSDFNQHEYGVTPDHFMEDGSTFTENRSLEILEVNDYYSRYSYGEMDISEQEIKESLGNLTDDIEVDNETKTVKITSEDEEVFDEYLNAIEELGLSFNESSKYVEAELVSKEIDLDEEEPYIIHKPEIYSTSLEVPLDAEGEVEAEVSFDIIHGEIIDIDADAGLDTDFDPAPPITIEP